MSETLRKIEALEAELQKLKNEVKPKYKENKWYKSKTNQLVFITEFRYYDVIGYGFGNKNDWFDVSEWMDDWESLELRLATHQEVEEALIKEAKKRGFKEGVRVLRSDSLLSANETSSAPNEVYIMKNKYSYNAYLNTLKIDGRVIFGNGVWAEIVKDEPIKIGGYSVVIKKSSFEKDSHNDSFEIGCKQMFRHQIQTIYYIMKNNNFKKVSFDGVETDLETINKILAL